MDGSRDPLGLPVPRQQPFELGSLGAAREHALEHVGEPRQGLDPVQLRGRHQAGHDRPVASPAVPGWAILEQALEPAVAVHLQQAPEPGRVLEALRLHPATVAGTPVLLAREEGGCAAGPTSNDPAPAGRRISFAAVRPLRPCPSPTEQAKLAGVSLQGFLSMAETINHAGKTAEWTESIS